MNAMSDEDLTKKIWSRAHDAGYLSQTAIVIELTQLESILGLDFGLKPKRKKP